MEKVGNIILDDTHYPGEDLYSDGAVEDYILKLVQTYSQEEYPGVIAREQDWAVMYHLAHERENILSWYPFAPGAKVLEVGSGCGAVTGAAAASAETVTCIDLSKKRSMVNAVRHKDSSNIKICLGNFQDVERDLDKDFDYATLIGVFEYGKGYIGGEKPYHGFLTTVMEHIRPGGKLLLAIENKFGLKYWAGCREDHVGTYFEGLEGYTRTEGVRTFSRPELIRIMEECGYKSYKFYYPYPDYKFPTAIYSDEYLPGMGELNQNICNFDRDRLVLMDEGKVYGQILKDGLFPLYSNSFFVEITKETGGDCLADAGQTAEEKVLYAKYSSGRGRKFSIQTRISSGECGRLFYKTAEYPEGQEHISRIAKAGKMLEEQWKEKSVFCPNQCTLSEARVYFEYLTGTTLEEKLDSLLEQGKIQAAVSKIKSIIHEILEQGNMEFSKTPEFQEVFGDISVPEKLQAVMTADIDLIFSNILVDKEGNYHVLDYEWTFFFPVPVEFIAYRALRYYLEAASKRKLLKEELNFYEYAGITPDRMKIYNTMENSFQKFISGNSVSVGTLYRTMGKRAFPLGELLAEKDQRRMQIYLNYGQGFSEENSYFVDHGYQEKIHCGIEVPKEVKSMWIDPALRACILKDVRLFWQDHTPAVFTTTGFEMEKNCYLFDNSDPKIIIEEIPEGMERIEISYQISILEEETAALLMDKVNTKGRMKKKVRGLLKG